tara:strand:+ start:104 stop:472 length:369 start_codon:yes stop_codon:yes gene_type:complete
MLDPNAVTKLEKALNLIKRREKDSEIRYLNRISAATWIIEGLLKETEDDINNIESTQRAGKEDNVMDKIPKALAKLKKEYDYGTPDKSNISTKSVQRNKNGTTNHRRKWNTDKQTKRNEQTA